MLAGDHVIGQKATCSGTGSVLLNLLARLGTFFDTGVLGGLWAGRQFGWRRERFTVLRSCALGVPDGG